MAEYMSIEQVAERFEKGITFEAARKWQERAKAASGRYKTRFSKYYGIFTTCSRESEEKGVYGFDRLLEYAKCVHDKTVRKE